MSKAEEMEKPFEICMYNENLLLKSEIFCNSFPGNFQYKFSYVLYNLIELLIGVRYHILEILLLITLYLGVGDLSRG